MVRADTFRCLESDCYFDSLIPCTFERLGGPIWNFNIEQLTAMLEEKGVFVYSQMATTVLAYGKLQTVLDWL